MSFARRLELWCSSGVKLWFVYLSVLATAACAGELPSAVPLGEGPLAKAEAVQIAKAEQEAEARAKSGDAGPSKPPGEAAPPPPTVAASPPPPAPATDKPKTEAPKSETKPGKDSGKKPGGAVIYAGEYVGSDTSVYKLAGNERSEKDDKARTRVEAKGNDLSITFVDSSNGKDICTLKATASGKSATLAAGQKCWAEPGMSGSLRSGKATFEDKRLIIDADFELELGGEGEGSVKGTLVYHFDGTRK